MLALALANGLVVLGLTIQIRAGLVSFGQALYYGLGAYAAAMLGHFAGVSDVFVMLAAGAAASAGVASVLGFLMARYRGIFFAMLSLAFSMILFGLLTNSAALGSTDGFGVPAPTFLGFAPADNARLTLLLFALVTLLALAIACAVQPLPAFDDGVDRRAIRENEVRAGLSRRRGAPRRACQIRARGRLFGSRRGAHPRCSSAMSRRKISSTGRSRANSCSSPSCREPAASPRRSSVR